MTDVSEVVGPQLVCNSFTVSIVLQCHKVSYVCRSERVTRGFRPWTSDSLFVLNNLHKTLQILWSVMRIRKTHTSRDSFSRPQGLRLHEPFTTPFLSSLFQRILVPERSLRCNLWGRNEDSTTKSWSRKEYSVLSQSRNHFLSDGM